LNAAGDLLVIVPSRGRPKNIARLLDSVHETSRMRTRLHVCVDEDDPGLPGYEYVMSIAGGEDDILEKGPRKQLAAWTNEIAVRRASQYPYLASLGDDHVPYTLGWDRALIKSIERMGGTGFAYPWDGTRDDIPEAVVLSSDIVRALGWMCEPSLAHWYPDVVWADLGRATGTLRHLRAIKVEHVRQADLTAKESGEKLAADRDAYFAWRKERMAGDIATLMKLREK
jgi:hypothetical protein